MTRIIRIADEVRLGAHETPRSHYQSTDSDPASLVCCKLLLMLSMQYVAYVPTLNVTGNPSHGIMFTWNHVLNLEHTSSSKMTDRKDDQKWGEVVPRGDDAGVSAEVIQ